MLLVNSVSYKQLGLNAITLAWVWHLADEFCDGIQTYSEAITST